MIAQHDKLVAALVERFGKPAVKVRNAHHIQVLDDERYHDIWIKATGQVRVRLAGNRKIQNVSVDRAVEIVCGHTHDSTDLGKMETAWKLAEFMDKSQAHFDISELPQAVYCDAGWKDGVGRMAVVRITYCTSGPSIEAHVRHMLCADSAAAEKEAISLAIGRYASLPIHSDNQGVVNVMQQKNPAADLRWIGRQKNKAADQLANMRRKARK